MQALWSRVNRWLTWFHRWAGVALCLLFAIWFASGAVLHFVSFPSLSAVDRHAGSEPIDFAQLLIEPSIALAKVPAATDLRLVSVAGRPTYLAQGTTGTWVSIAGDTGEVLPLVSARLATTIAERFSGIPAARISGPLDYDQWVVHQHFDPFRPFYRVRLNNSEGTDVYVSARTGEVLQRTQFAQRAWNWSGAVIHWIYFTPLRKSWSAWNQVVWWVSLAALLSSAVGTWLGIIRMIANRAAGRKGLSPFRGWMRWHHIIGLFASVIVVTWMLSGWLSMDHGRLFSRPEPTRQQSQQVSGLTMRALAQAISLPSIVALTPATEITFNALAGHALITAYDSTGEVRSLFPDSSPIRVLSRLSDPLLLSGLEPLWPDHVHPAVIGDAYDRVYRLAESATDDTAVFEISGESLRVYMDRHSARVLAVMDTSRRQYAWIYYALHTFQFPGLIEHPQIRSVVVLALLALGFISSLTGVVLSVKRLRREFA
jgi:PepSY-associated TM region